jgi:hypothetical protein
MSGQSENSHITVIPAKAEIHYVLILNGFPIRYRMKKIIIYRFLTVWQLNVTGVMLFALLHSSKNNENNKHPAMVL